MRHSRVCLLLLFGIVGSLAFVAPAGAAFRGSNGRIVFVSDRDAPGSNGREIYTAAADGSDPRRLTANSVPDTDPAYSPDGTKIAFVRANDIWVMNADGSGQAPITGVEGPDSQPAWSPDGGQIVYVSNQGTPGGYTTGFELFVTSAGGSGTPRRLTDTPNNVSSRAPAWSPAGNEIAYESNADGSFEIYTIDPAVTAGFGTRRSANGLAQNYQNPSWSPDGARIAYERGTGTMLDDPSKEIWTMKADGSDAVPLTSNGVYDAQPAYSPDGARIAYETREGGHREVYTRPATAGGAPTDLTQTAVPVTDEQPDWGWGGPPAPKSSPVGGSPGGGPSAGGLGAPTLGVDVIVEPVSGTVLVGVKGSAFVRLTAPRRIPVGSLVDARKGKVRVVSATGSPGGRQSGSFSGSAFQVRQSAKRSAKGLTDLVLKGSGFRACEAAGAHAARRTIRRLRASAKGRFKVTARNSAATVLAGTWQVEDRCDGTLTKVRRGRLVVRDLRRGRSVRLRAGQSYLAKARS